MCVFMDVVQEVGKLCEGVFCYIGDIFDSVWLKYDFKYYVGLVKELEVVGVYIFGIKDMVGFLKLEVVKILVMILKQEMDLLIYFYIYDMFGIVVVSILVVVEVGVDVVDVVMDVLFGLILQFCFGFIVEVLCGSECDMGLDVKIIWQIFFYWEVVWIQYWVFESDLCFGVLEVYLYEMLGGQFINLKEQVCLFGLEI